MEGEDISDVDELPTTRSDAGDDRDIVVADGDDDKLDRRTAIGRSFADDAQPENEDSNDDNDEEQADDIDDDGDDGDGEDNGDDGDRDEGDKPNNDDEDDIDDDEDEEPQPIAQDDSAQCESDDDRDFSDVDDDDNDDAVGKCDSFANTADATFFADNTVETELDDIDEKGFAAARGDDDDDDDNNGNDDDDDDDGKRPNSVDEASSADAESLATIDKSRIFSPSTTAALTTPPEPAARLPGPVVAAVDAAASAVLFPNSRPRPNRRRSPAGSENAVTADRLGVLRRCNSNDYGLARPLPSQRHQQRSSSIDHHLPAIPGHQPTSPSPPVDVSTAARNVSASSYLNFIYFYLRTTESYLIVISSSVIVVVL